MPTVPMNEVITNLRRFVRLARPEYPESHVNYVAYRLYEPFTDLVRTVGTERYVGAVTRLDLVREDIRRYFAEHPI